MRPDALNAEGVPICRPGAMQLLQATDIEQGTVAYLRGTLGIKQAGYRDKIIARKPSESEAKFFLLPNDSQIPVIETRRIAFSEESTPIRLTVSIYPADRNELIVNVGRVSSGSEDSSMAVGRGA